MRFKDKLLSFYDAPLQLNATLKHYYFFDQELSSSRNGIVDPDDWDKLRINSPHFTLSDDREQWMRDITENKDGQYRSKERAQALCDLFAARGYTNVHSVAVGAAALEFNIKTLHPDLTLTASEFAPLNVARLKTVFRECDRIELFDIKTSDWSRIQEGSSRSNLVLMYRADPHLTNKEWRSVFRKLHKSEITNVLFMPADIISLRYAWLIQERRIRSAFTRRKLTCTGFVRTEKAFISLWDRYFHTEPLHIDGMRSFLLSHR